jgi:excisionase family DNA binding protein
MRAGRQARRRELVQSRVEALLCSQKLDIARMQSEPDSKPLDLSISQAARELGVSLGTVRRWSDMGYIKAYRTPGGQRRYSRAQIDEFVRSLRRGPGRGA